jgi:acyl-coenzyme A thioesterase PaaI-like protein
MATKKVLNPYKELPGYRCFGCSPDNENGLRMEFENDGEYIISRWDPRSCFQGYLNVLHGGIQATLLDEIASWVIMVHLKTGGVTSRLEMRYLKKVMVNEGPLLIRAKLLEQRHRIASIKAELFNAAGELASEATVQYFLLSEEMAKEKLAYPGVEKFTEASEE